ncbi:MAG: hypothetical protein ACLQA5_10155 [Solirubrobacteraceae bacterium]
MNSTLETVVSIFLLFLTFPSPKSKNVCHPTYRRGAGKPPSRSTRS